MPVAIVSCYAGLNALIVLTLAVLVVRQRGQTKTLFGAGESPALQQAIRAHGNIIEYAPLILLLLLLLALIGLGAPWLHGLGIALTLGRVLHAWGLSTNSGTSFGRSAGILLTWVTLAVALVLCIVRGVMAM
jgi:uncharacterized membrane protein YecN with MAPEG domain